MGHVINALIIMKRILSFYVETLHRYSHKNIIYPIL